MNSQEVIVVGANHRTSTMRFRDRLHIDAAAMPVFLESLRANGVETALVLSVPDRVEVVATAADAVAATTAVSRRLAEKSAAPPGQLGGAVYAYRGAEAVRHLFAEAAALDDVVIGEPRLRGELEAAHRKAAEHGMDSAGLRALLAAAGDAADAVRRITGFDERPATIPAAAIRVARDLHGNLGRCAGLLIGVGELGEAVARALLDRGLDHLTVVHGDDTRAEAIASSLDCHVARMDETARLLVKSEIVVTATNTRRHVVDVDGVAAALAERRRRPMLFIDTGVPGDVDPAVDKLDDAFRYTLDDLERVARKGRAEREAVAAAGWQVIDDHVRAFLALGPLPDDDGPHVDTPTQEARRHALAEAARDRRRSARMKKSLLQRLLGGGDKE